MTIIPACTRMTIAVFLLSTTVFGAQAAQQQVAQTTETSGANADRGKQTYVKKGCYACHGREAQGSPTTGPRLGPNPIPLATFTRYVRAPRGQMPPYSEKVITDAELADMHAFLQTRSGPAAIESLLK